MLRYGLHILVAVLGLLLQSTVFAEVSADILKPDLAFLVVVYLGLHRPTGEATPAIVIIGYLADRFSALPDGSFLLIYLCSFYLAAGISKVLYFRGTGFPALMVLGLSLIYGLSLDLMVRYGRIAEDAEQQSGPFFGHGLGFFALFALVNVLFSLPVNRMCRLVDGDDDLRTGQRATL